MKIRIFALAKELGYDSKELIAICNNAGIEVKTSALASISPEEKDILMAHLATLESQPEEATDDRTAPTREEVPAERMGKVRAIRTMTPRGQGVRQDEEPEVEEPTAEAVETEEPTAEPAAETETTEADDSSTEQVVTAEAEATAPETDAAPSASQSPEDDATEPAEETSKAPEQNAPDSKTEEPAGSEAMTKDDYVGVGGSSAMRPVREMRPRGSIQEGAAKKAKAKPKPKPKPSLPNLALPPEYKAVTPKKKSDDAPAQKPDMKLTADILDSHSPLAAHLKKSHDKSKGRGEEGEGGSRKRMAGGSLQGQRDERRQQRKRNSGRRGFDDDYSPREMRRRVRKRTGPIEYKSEATVELPMTVRSLSEAMGRQAKEIMRILFQQGKMLTINDAMDEELAMEVALELGVDLTIERQKDIEEAVLERFDEEQQHEDSETRPPVVTILGHVDHGKTTLVDTLRSSNVAAGEAGGITQHIAAYQVNKDGQKITFVDTPGHAAFGEMRARGANVTDIIVLVVAANDGVMPQTMECISHAKAAGVPLIVAMNKIDLPDINEQKVLQELAANEVLPVEWGGEVEVVRTSGLTGEGVDDLLETILLTAEIQEHKASPSAPVKGVCLEAFRDEGRGPIAWVIVQQGTLRIGDVVLCGQTFGRVRAMYNDKDEEMTEAGPSTPLKLAGLEDVPGAGDRVYIVSDIEEAREVAAKRHLEDRASALSKRGGPKTLADILSKKRGERGVQDLPLIIKADTPGSVEALRGEIGKFEHPEVQVTIIHEAVGGVNESDVTLAAASGAIIIAFHVVAEDRALALADDEGVEIRRYRIIYEVTSDIKDALEGLLAPKQVETSTGRALVLQTFSISRSGTIAGCRVLNGTISRNDRVHVIRDQKLLNDYSIGSLRREKEDVKEVREGMECGIRLESFNDVKEGDLLEAYRVDEVKRTLDSE